jgi:hypothetical protein
MRTSQAGLAIIQQRDAWLVHWNDNWNAYSLIGGHVETGESFRESCIREIAEELRCSASQLNVNTDSHMRLNFREFSRAAKVETEYEWELFLASVDERVLQNLPDDCVWVTHSHIRSGVAANGKPIADQVGRALQAYVKMSTPTIEFSGRVREQLPVSVRNQIAVELPRVFSNIESGPVISILVPRLFAGYAPDFEAKVVLAVELVVANGYERHIVKVGAQDEVARDFDGWHACTRGRMVASRIFSPVRKIVLDGDRVAIVYRDAFSLFGPDEGSSAGSAPESLEDAVAWAVKDNEPDPLSAQRAISHIYTDLGVWFYRGAIENRAKSFEFYNKRLGPSKRVPHGPTILEQWNALPARADLRRHAVWVLCGRDAADADPIAKPARYLDPVDYISWVMTDSSGKRLPRTLVGCAHGDLHAQNILVGVRRGEVQYPAVFDYGDMGPHNIPVWDFAKLETELKVRRLAEIIRQPDAMQWLLNRSNLRNSPMELADKVDPGANARRADRLAAFLAFEEYIDSQCQSRSAVGSAAFGD